MNYGLLHPPSTIFQTVLSSCNCIRVRSTPQTNQMPMLYGEDCKVSGIGQWQQYKCSRTNEFGRRLLEGMTGTESAEDEDEDEEEEEGEIEEEDAL
jgi:hypothetical protein